jgi:hypothetical protein
VRDRRHGPLGPRPWDQPGRRHDDVDTEQTIVTGPPSVRVRQGLRRHGVFETALGFGMKVFGRLFGCLLLVCLAWENAQGSGSASIDLEPTRARRLSRAQLEGAAIDPTMDLRADFVQDALAHGDACYGVLDLDKVVSYCWFSTRCTEVLPGFTIAFPADCCYSYKAFTRPAYRGKGLLRECQVAAAKDFTSRGALHLLTLIERRNVSSLKAFGQVGFHPFGRVVLWRTRWFNRAMHTSGCRQHDLRIDTLPPRLVDAQPEAKTSPPPVDVR